jgi:hypothetical protein
VSRTTHAERPSGTGSRRPRRALLLVALVVVVSASAFGTAMVWSQSGAEPGRPSFHFAPEQIDGDLVVVRRWTVDRGTGRIRGVVRLVNGGSERLTDVAVDEVLPRSLVRSDAPSTVEPIEQVGTTSVPPEVVDRVGQVLTYRTGALDPHRYVEFTYEVELRDPAGEGGVPDGVLLPRWAADQSRARSAYFAEVHGGAAPEVVVLEEFSARPEHVRMRRAGRFRLDLRGTMSDGSAASPAVLLGLAWESSDGDVVSAADGTLESGAPGEATVVASAGTERERLRVRVLADHADATLVEEPATPFDPPVLLAQGEQPRGGASPVDVPTTTEPRDEEPADEELPPSTDAPRPAATTTVRPRPRVPATTPTSAPRPSPTTGPPPADLPAPPPSAPPAPPPSPPPTSPPPPPTSPPPPPTPPPTQPPSTPPPTTAPPPPDAERPPGRPERPGDGPASP